MRTKRHDGGRRKAPSEHEAMLDLMRKVNCNDRREPDAAALALEEATARAHRLAAVTYLSAVL